MFGSGRDHLEQLVKKNKWDSISKKLNRADVQTRLDIAAACSNSSEDESMNILIRLLTDSEESVQLEAIKSLGISGRTSTKSHLNWLSEHVGDKENLKQAIKEALASISKRQ